MARGLDREARRQHEIAFVGDSFTFGQWASTAERSLVGVFDAEMRPLEVDVNFGVPGYGFLEIERLETDVSAFHPTIALVSFNGNDFMDTYVGFSRCEIRPNGTLRTNGDNIAEKIPAPFYRQRGSRHIAAERIYLFNIVQAVLKGARSRRRRPTGFPPRRPPFGGRDRVEHLLEPKAVSALRRSGARRLHRGLDRGVRRGERRQADHHRASDPQQVYFADSFPETYDAGLPQRHLEESRQVPPDPVFSIAPPMAEHYRRTGANLHFQQEGHFNDEGHRNAGGAGRGSLQRRDRRHAGAEREPCRERRQTATYANERRDVPC